MNQDALADAPATSLREGAAGAGDGPGWLTIGALLAAFIGAWLLYGVVAHQGIIIHDDMMEAYVWGREFQLGYNQHPPFWAWLAGVWFLVFPHRDWAFQLLAMLNSAVGLVGAWMLMGQFLRGPARQAAWLLLLCTPFYTFAAMKYNANTIFISIWPWMLYYFMRTMENQRWRDSVLFGVMVALGLLSKYYTAVLIATCLLGSLLHPNARAYWRSYRPWLSMAIAIALFTPHVIWLFQNDFPPFRYTATTMGRDWGTRVWQGVAILGSAAGLQLLIPLLAWLGRGRVPVGQRYDVRLLTVLVVTPVILTVALGLFAGLRLRDAMVVGTFPLTPVLVLYLLRRIDPPRLVRWSAYAVMASTVIALLSAPISNRLINRPRDPGWNLPIREVANATAALWHQETGLPVRNVGGSDFYSNAAVFYMRDRPSGFLLLQPSLSLWMTPERLRTGGLLAFCTRDLGTDEERGCRAQAERLSTPRTVVKQITLTHRVRGHDRGTQSLDVYIIPPES